jgi:type IV secretory pathway VirB6-like protein
MVHYQYVTEAHVLSVPLILTVVFIVAAIVITVFARELYANLDTRATDSLVVSEYMVVALSHAQTLLFPTVELNPAQRVLSARIMRNALLRLVLVLQPAMPMSVISEIM